LDQVAAFISRLSQISCTAGIASAKALKSGITTKLMKPGWELATLVVFRSQRKEIYRFSNFS